MIQVDEKDVVAIQGTKGVLHRGDVKSNISTMCINTVTQLHTFTFHKPETIEYVIATLKKMKQYLEEDVV